MPPATLTVIVPRHPQRFAEVATLLRERGVPFVRRSDNAPVPADIDVVLGDSMGEMTGYCAAADVVFIGGSLLPLGGQNLIEPIALGRPTLVGPHMFNFADATDKARAAGAALEVADAAALGRGSRRLARRFRAPGRDGRGRARVPCRAPRRGRQVVALARADGIESERLKSSRARD